MPYIKQDRRVDLNPRCTGAQTAQTPGELNYQLTEVVCDYLHTFGRSYKTFNDIIGALESCKLEFYRRMVAPYENDAIERNGDCY